MAKKVRFRDTYLYRFLIITVAFAMIITPVASVSFAVQEMNAVAKWVILGVLLALYVAALIYSYFAFRKKKLEK